jgi:hypothetical protein
MMKMSETERQKNVQITIPDTTFQVEEGLPELPTTGRSGESKYSSLMEQARKLRPGTKFRVPVGAADPQLQRTFIRNLRVAIKRFAPKLNLKVTAAENDGVWLYRDMADSAPSSAKSSR